MKTRTAVAASLAAVVGAALFIGLSRDAQLEGVAPADTRRRGAPSDATAPSGLADVAHVLPPGTTYVPPAQDVRLQAVIGALRAAADRGDARAQCRLAFELYRCTQIPSLRKRVEQSVGMAARVPGGSADEREKAQEVRHLQAIVDRDTAICEGVSLADMPDAWQYGLRAAKSGHVPSILRFVLQPPLDEQDFGKDLEGWQAYRQWAGPLLVQAAERGDPTAAYHLSLAYSGFPMPGGTPILEPNDELALTHAIVSQSLVDDRSVRVIQRRVDALEARMDAGARARAAANAQRVLATRHMGEERRLDIADNPIPQTPIDCDQP